MATLAPADNAYEGPVPADRPSNVYIIFGPRYVFMTVNSTFLKLALETLVTVEEREDIHAPGGLEMPLKNDIYLKTLVLREKINRIIMKIFLVLISRDVFQIFG